MSDCPSRAPAVANSHPLPSVSPTSLPPAPTHTRSTHARTHARTHKHVRSDTLAAVFSTHTAHRPPASKKHRCARPLPAAAAAPAAAVQQRCALWCASVSTVAFRCGSFGSFPLTQKTGRRQGSPSPPPRAHGSGTLTGAAGGEPWAGVGPHISCFGVTGTSVRFRRADASAA